MRDFLGLRHESSFRGHTHESPMSQRIIMNIDSAQASRTGMRASRQKGFSLIELMVVVAI
ncbi:prepilin-type N-terminal cleavage/methylation domain-containing protein, partial [Listeria seeligeri]|uniref:prepilin-type N-terminal cleavage/methylation domain-containing protein n=1 Tax=Listeria seeligeri TaxID=1640 RepID=UPI0034D3B719